MSKKKNKKHWGDKRDGRLIKGKELENSELPSYIYNYLLNVVATYTNPIRKIVNEELSIIEYKNNPIGYIQYYKTNYIPNSNCDWITDIVEKFNLKF